MQFDCLTVGIVVADFVCAPVPKMPGAGELAMTESLSLAIGGCASNVAVDLCKLGLKVGLVGRTGDDVPGEFVRNSLRAAAVDTTHLIATSGEQTSGTLVINVRGEDRRFIHAFGANGVFDGSEVTPELIRSARVLYLGGFFLMPRLTGAAVAKMFQTARAAGVPTVLDVAIPDPRNCWPELAAALPFTDVFLPNIDEGRQLTGLDDPLTQAEKFRDAGAGTVVITCGRDGAVLVNASEKLRAPAFKVDFVDGTGSGDAFAAGYISGLLNGDAPKACLTLGSSLGASCVRQPGATTGVFTRAELDSFLSREHIAIERIG